MALIFHNQAMYLNPNFQTLNDNLHDLELLTIQDKFDRIQQSHSTMKMEVAKIGPNTYVWKKKSLKCARN